VSTKNGQAKIQNDFSRQEFRISGKQGALENDMDAPADRQEATMAYKIQTWDEHFVNAKAGRRLRQ
jgi:hypothetical protein